MDIIDSLDEDLKSFKRYINKIQQPLIIGISITGLFLFIFCAGLINSLSDNDRSYSTTNTDPREKYRNEAIEGAELIIPRLLKSPHTANFVVMEYFSVRGTTDRVMVKGIVEAQNDFGARLRNNFYVVYEIVDDELIVKDLKVYR